MTTLKENAMHILESTIERYEAAGESCTESAIRDLFTGLRHYCDQREIDFEGCLEGSLDAHLEEQEDAGDEGANF